MNEAAARAGDAGAGEGFELQRFEYVPVSRDTALLRVVGRWDSESPTAPSQARLVLSDRGTTTDFEPISVGDDAAQWSVPGQQSCGVAFAVPAAVLDRRGVRFSLRLARGFVVGLGAPTRRGLGAPPASTPPTDDLRECRRRLGEVVAARRDLDRRAAELRRSIDDHGRPLDAWRAGRRDAGALAGLDEEIREGLMRLSALEAHLVGLARELRSPRGRTRGFRW